MQGQRSSLNALPENLFFDDGSISDDPLVSTQVSWSNNSDLYEQSRPGYTLPSNHPNSVQFLQHSGLYDQWNSGESSSSASQLQVNLNEPEESWSFGSRGVLSFENLQHETSNNTLSLGNNDSLNLNINQTTAMRFISQNSGSVPCPRDLSMSPGLGSNMLSSNVQTQSTFSSLENQCTSRKRKALELNTGQSSGEGSSRHRLVIGDSVSSSPFSLTASGNAESSRRNNLRLRVNGSTHQRSLQLGSSTYSSVGNVESLSSHDSSRTGHNPVLDLNPTPVVENMNLHMQPVPQHIPNNVHRIPPSRFGSSSSSTNIQEHPMFLSSAEIENASQNCAFFNPSAITAQTHHGTGLNSSEMNWPNQTFLRPRRQVETVRRPMLPSSGVESSARSSSPGLYMFGRRARAALLERHSNATTVGSSRSLRTMIAAADDEGRSSAMPEHVRRVLEIVRRGEGIRFEDLMLLDHPAIVAMAANNMHDRHRDMRMDVDNMSYEELLALEERIGNVCTGLSEETIMKHMKQQKYTNDMARDQGETEPCSICREEYNEGEDLGKLECGHDFHRDCIKQWLTHKNLCPICKTPGLST